MAGQDTHTVAPVWPTYCPALQAEHPARLDGWPVPVPYEPDAQAVQAELICAPSMVENIPARQAWHVVPATALSAVEYVPAKHWVQPALVGMPFPVWYVPAMHGWQMEMVVAPEAVEYIPVPQPVQNPERPVAELYFPASQSWQVLLSMARLAVEVVPAEQLVQTVVPIPDWYVPPTHPLQMREPEPDA